MTSSPNWFIWKYGPIIGRAEEAEWWLIQLADGGQGWVADNAVIVEGYISIVPALTAPPLNGQTPTPGAPWNPTPYPFCTVTPTHTATATAVPPTSTPEIHTLPDAATNTPIPPTETATAVPPTITSGKPTNTPPPPPGPATVSDRDNQKILASQTTDPMPTPEPLTVESGTNEATNLLPIAGLGLVAFGVFGVIFIRRRQP